MTSLVYHTGYTKMYCAVRHYWRRKFRQGDRKEFVVCAWCGHAEEIHP